MLKEKDPSDNVAGTGRTGRYAGQIGRWLALAEGDRETWERIRAWFDDHRPQPGGTGLLSFASLLRYRPR